MPKRMSRPVQLVAHPRFRPSSRQQLAKDQSLHHQVQCQDLELGVLTSQRLSLAPRIFTKSMEAALAPLHCQGNAFANVDDLFSAMDSRDQTMSQTQVLVTDLQALRFLINLRKTLFIPCQRILFLGMEINYILTYDFNDSSQQHWGINSMLNVVCHLNRCVTVTPTLREVW